MPIATARSRHAFERLIGLAPVALGGTVGLVDEDGGIALAHAPGNPGHEPIIRTLVDRAERFVGAARRRVWRR